MESPLITLPVVQQPQPKPVVQNSDIAYRYCGAVLGAWAAELGTYPLDLLKTRLQIQSEVATAKAGYKLENYGMLTAALRLVREEGITKFYSGLSAVCQRHIAYAGLRLVFYEKYREIFKDESGKLTVFWSALGGVTCGAMAQFFANPADLVKVQMQAEGRRILQGKKRRFNNCWQVYVMLYKKSGILGFWRGALPNMQRAAFVNIGDLAAYDFSKQLLIREFHLKDNIICHTFAAFAAGFVGAVLGTPADVLKTRIMNQPLGPDGRGKLYRGMIDCLQQSVKNEGFFSLYKGFFPFWIRLGPWALINWLAFENIMILMGRKTF